MTRAQLVVMVRLLIGIGILLLMLVLLRACFSPPMLPTKILPEPQVNSALPEKY